MTRYTLTVLDTTQIQNYVFGSNRLQENIGGSQLVELATHQWAYEALPAPHNVLDTKTGRLDSQETIDQLAAEVVYAGGGNTVVLFRTIDLAREFARQLTRRVLREAPGLELVVAHQDFDWQDDSLAVTVQETLGRDLARKKQNRQPSLPLLGLGVTAACDSTGLAAVSATDKGQLASREIAAKLSDPVRESAEKRLLSLLPHIRDGGWEIPRDHDDMGRMKGEESYLAVVHADGNRMGQRVERLAQQYQAPERNRAYIDAMRAFSQQVETASQGALAATANLLAQALQQDPELPVDHPYFPFRPIVFGGDDVTFVCNGRYGLPLVVKYLQEFERETARQPAFDGEPAHACAGVTVVKVHYPFARAYRLSEALCHSAKELAKEQQADCSALDWHFARSGITGTVKRIREREYEVNLESERQIEPEQPHETEAKPTSRPTLCMRPVLLSETADDWRTWPIFESLTAAFAVEEGEWYERRNKVKALREALRDGPEAVREFLRTYRLEKLPGAERIRVAGVGETGWYGQTRCVYFDPIEAMDFYVSLEKSASGLEGGSHAKP